MGLEEAAQQAQIYSFASLFFNARRGRDEEETGVVEKQIICAGNRQSIPQARSCACPAGCAKEL